MTARMFETPGVVEEVLVHGRRRDIAGFVAVPVLLAVIFLAFGPNVPALTFDPTRPTVLSAFLAHFAHASISHLMGNLAVYLVAVGVGYPLALLCGCRRLYLFLVSSILLLLPFVLSTVSLVFLPTTSVIGFSGLALGLIGTIPPVLFRFLRSRVHPAFSVGDAIGLFLVGTAAMTWQAAGSLPAGRPLSVAIVGVGLVSLTPVGRRIGNRPNGLEVLSTDLLLLVVTAVLLVLLAVAMTVPSGATLAATRTTMLLHLLGYSGGFGVTMVTMGWLRIRRAPRPKPGTD